MSVSDRLRDADILWASGRKVGAYLMLLVATAATARKRYPRPVGDKEAFTRFLLDEMDTVVGFKGFRMGMPMGGGKSKMLEELLYEHFRCNLIHEGTMPEEIFLTPSVDARGLSQNVIVHGDPHGIPENFVLNLRKVVMAAPENAVQHGV